MKDEDKSEKKRQAWHKNINVLRNILEILFENNRTRAHVR